jgi:hypothetical protein
MVSIRARSPDVSSVELASAMPERAVDFAYTSAKPPSTNNSMPESGIVVSSCRRCRG